MTANATPVAHHTTKFKANKWIHVLLDHLYKTHIVINILFVPQYKPKQKS